MEASTQNSKESLRAQAICDRVRIPIMKPNFIRDARYVDYLWLMSRVSPRVKMCETLIIGQSCPVSQELIFQNHMTHLWHTSKNLRVFPPRFGLALLSVWISTPQFLFIGNVYSPSIILFLKALFSVLKMGGTTFCVFQSEMSLEGSHIERLVMSTKHF